MARIPGKRLLFSDPQNAPKNADFQKRVIYDIVVVNIHFFSSISDIGEKPEIVVKALLQSAINTWK